MRPLRAGALAALVIAASASPATSQTARVLRNNGDGTFDVVIGSDTLLAIGTQLQRQLLKVRADLDAARRELAAKDSTIRAYERTVAAFDTLRLRQRTYVSALEEQVTGYQRLADGYRRLSRANEGWLSVDGGLGATGDSRPTLLVGVGIRRLRVWGIMQEHNGGAAVGVHLPIF